MSLISHPRLYPDPSLCVRLAPVESINADLMEGLRAVTSLNANVLHSLADRIAAGLLTLLRAHAGHIKEREDWRSVLSLLQELAAMPPNASRLALACTLNPNP